MQGIMIVFTSSSSRAAEAELQIRQDSAVKTAVKYEFNLSSD